MVRCMLKEKKLPKKFWGDVVVYVMYLLNRFSTKKNYRRSHKKKHKA